MKMILLTMTALFMLSASCAEAQVTIGSLSDPQEFSILELVSTSGGLRLPQLTTEQRETLQATVQFQTEKTNKAKGLQIFNTTTDCIETWSGAAWISSCPCNTLLPAPSQTSMVLDITKQGDITAGDYPQYRFYSVATDGEPLAKSFILVAGTYYISNVDGLYCESSRTRCTVRFGTPVTTIPETKGGDTWTKKRWVGAFWRDDQTGERVIASKVSNPSSDTWSVSIENSGTTGSWLTLDGNGGYDPNLWTDNPDDAEEFQLPSARVTEIASRTGHILFRIGALSKNTQTDNSYDTKIKPRYAKVILTVNNTPYTIYCRQGHSADYVFRKEDKATGGDMTNAERNLAAKFSPYNLTNELINETTTFAATGVGIATDGSYKGKFVDYPTQIGAFFQWAGISGNETFAFHPSAYVSYWVNNYLPGYWSDLGATHETCPKGWRRPTVGAINDSHLLQAASGSELMQSLFEVPFNDATRNQHGNNHRYWGYYADGYFDRCAIATSVSGQASSAVSRDTKDAAYIGVLYTNPASDSGASLFAPAGGLRPNNGASVSSSGNSGSNGYYWSSSADGTSTAWCLHFDSDEAYQSYLSRSYGFAVRCVVNE
ncbi:MAG: DUF1566 domain-containing protein [Dysgonamonadaceae bacterium]|jgi:hypothetical protein|nr:DUF1566 domain-containing protein [Dysgonamonadaceae bacterium]